MSREWRPGDVALICVPRKTAPGELVTATGDTFVRACHVSGGGWVSLENPDYFWGKGYTFHAEPPRPLVVIDPESREQTAALAEELYVHGLTVEGWRPHDLNDVGERYRVGMADKVQAALRNLITPPKPEEPTGLGAVVKDAKGRCWTRIWGNTESPWRCAGHSSRTWEHLDAVKILSEGVTP